MYKIWKKSVEKYQVIVITRQNVLLAAILSAILKTVGRTKPIFELIRDTDDWKACMKFGRNPLRNVEVIVVTRKNVLLAAILSAILATVGRTKPIFELIRDIDD